MAWITCCFTWKMEALLSILLANTRSLDNKLDELRRMMALFSERETRLDSSLDSAIVSQVCVLHSLPRVDSRIGERGKCLLHAQFPRAVLLTRSTL